MNIIVVFFLVLFAVGFWGLFTICTPCQKCLHFLGPLTPFLQWYTILFVGLVGLIGRTFRDIVVFEYIRFDFLEAPALHEAFHTIPNVTAAEVESLHITPWLRKFSLAAPVFGALAALVVSENVISMVRAHARKDKALPWRMNRERFTILVVIAMPLVFILFAMRAEIRIWAVMTGSCWLPYAESRPAGVTWEKVRDAEMALYSSDIEMASFFVFITINTFARLCANYLTAAPEEYRFTLKWAGLQGVYLYVIFGAIRSLANVIITLVVGLPQMAAYKDKLLSTQAQILEKSDPVFAVATVLCVYNMIILCGMKDIKDKLGNANMKFQATRILVLLAQFQMKILIGLTVGSKIYEMLMHLPPKYAVHVDPLLKSWHLSVPRAQLMHAALLNVECLFVALFNRLAWSASADYGANEKVSAREIPAVDEEASQGRRSPLEERLLTAA
eukprot:TRINITY_DN6463_c0_g3_i1.p1 TRINITY_DN6463_c0_g3~~TRINITY_DN6463_c0_g3_i1.p1  ORF type:complete len:465 (-),score=92.98 TRINITY_DN6463_c0_g3_i1:46-1380(-)